MNRYARQERVLGAAAQKRLSACTVSVQSAGIAGTVEARYLAGAGVRSLRAADPAALFHAQAVNAAVETVLAAPSEAPEDAPAWVRSLAPAAQAFVTGALRALSTMRKEAGE